MSRKSSTKTPTASPPNPILTSWKMGYARVSTDDQSLDLQLDALREAKCQKIFQEVATGKHSGRPQLSKCLEELRPGDTLVVWKLDRLGRSLPDLVDIINDLATKGVAFESLTENIETGSPTGKLVFHVFAALADFERSLIRERTMAGLAAAKRQGRLGGRPRKMTPETVADARRAISGGMPLAKAAKLFGVGKTTLYQYLNSNAPRQGE